MYSPSVYHSLKSKYNFIALPRNFSKSFGTVEYDAHIITKIEKSVEHVSKIMTILKLHTLVLDFELGKTKLLTILAMSVQNPLPVGYLSTGNRSTFLALESSSARSHNSTWLLSTLHGADKSFDRIPLYYQDAVLYVDPITRQAIDYATPIACDNGPQKIMSLDLDL